MSNSKMLIDASHPEETRVVVLKGNRVEEFDFEAANKKQLRGNIYLAKVTRVEPSLQAAFVEYGGNRHGFLAFSEIHPDYYQIPFADRQALVEEEARAHRDEDDENRIQDAGGGGENRSGQTRSDQRGGENRAGGENRSGQTRSDQRGGENRSGGENRGGGESRGGGDSRGGRDERGGRGERSERGDRSQRRSRRHRRDGSAPMDRRGPADESISSPAFEAVEADATPTALDVDLVDAVETRTAIPGSVDTDVPSDLVPDSDGSLEQAETGIVSADAPPADATEAPSRHEASAAEPIVTETPVPVEASASVEAPTLSEPASPAEVAADHEPASHAVGSPSMDVESALSPAQPETPEPDRLMADDDHDFGTEHDAAGADHDDALPAAVEARESSAGDDHADEDGGAHEDEHVEQLGGDALSDVVPRPVRLRRHYKIQEVIKRRQILLIQVVKEERGNKGAALTTYLSLAGRYSVLMPNTAKGGGISRKITDGEDRKRLKAIAQELDVPEGMGVILRTAGAARSPIEVRRDFEYLLRMWESVRELTLKSTAPSLVYEEGSLIKRSIRDLYGKEVEEVVVAGEAGFSEARDFMRMLMPGNVKSVVPYRDPTPIFAKAGVEAQLDAMFSPHVTLKSGGYLVINQTEALVAIDVNSGRSTREHNIEDTALRTNLEAADEVARQLRLRDLAGLIVVDFIDMDEGRNNRAVERRIKEALKNDRARIQIGRISHFGLLEMSRQRIRTGVLEGSTMACPHCAGAGTVRSTASIALHVLRLLEDALIKDASHDLIVRSRGEVALYMLNQKRTKLVELELRFGVTITVVADPALTGMLYHAIERGELATPAIAPAPRQDLVRVDSIAPVYDVEDAVDEEFVEEAEAESQEAIGAEEAPGEGGEARRRKRRRRRRGRERDGSEVAAEASLLPESGFAAVEDGVEDSGADAEETDVATVSETAEEPEASFARHEPAVEPADAERPALAEAVPPTVVVMPLVADASDETAEDATPVAEVVPRPRRSRRTAVPEIKEAEVVAAASEDVPARPRRRRPSRARAAKAETTAPVEDVASAEAVVADLDDVSAPVLETVSAPEAGEATVPAADTPSPQADGQQEAAKAQAPSSDAAAAPGDGRQPAPAVEASDPDRPKRSGWWQRAKASFGT